MVLSGAASVVFSGSMDSPGVGTSKKPGGWQKESIGLLNRGAGELVYRWFFGMAVVTYSKRKEMCW